MKKEINQVVKERRRELEGTGRDINFSSAHELRILADKCDSVLDMLENRPEAADVPVLLDELKAAVARLHARLSR